MLRAHSVTLVAVVGGGAAALAAQVHLYLGVLVGALALAPLFLWPLAQALRHPLPVFCLLFAEYHMFSMTTGGSPERFVDLLFLGLMVWWVAGIFAGDWRIRRLPPRYALWGGLVVVWALISALASIDVGESVPAAIYYVSIPLGLWMFNDLLDSERALLRFFDWLILGVAIYSCVVLVLLADRSMADGVSMNNAFAVHFALKQHLFGVNPNGIPTLPLYCVPFVLARFLDRPAARWLNGALFLLFAGVIVLSMSRATWLGAAVGCTACYLLFEAQRGNWGRLLKTTGAMLLVATVFLAANWSTLQSLLFVQRGTAGRGFLWEAALRMVADHPITGIGPGMWRAMAASYAVYSGPLDMTHGAAHAHNAFLMAAAEQGMAGVLLTVTYAGLLLKDGLSGLFGRDAGLSPDFRAHLVACVAVVGALATRGLFEATMVVWPGSPIYSIWLTLVAVSMCRMSDRR